LADYAVVDLYNHLRRQNTTRDGITKLCGVACRSAKSRHFHVNIVNHNVLTINSRAPVFVVRSGCL